MKKIILVLCCFIFAFAMAEAKTYTNTRRGYAIDIPDYFVIKDNYGGKYDLIADGGDGYGLRELLSQQPGIEMSINSESYYKTNVTLDDLQEIIRQYRANALKFGIQTEYSIIESPTGHYQILSMTARGNVAYIGTIAFWHGNKIEVSLSCYIFDDGKKVVQEILESLRCIAH